MHLLWFRRDLRLTDNDIITLATAANAPVLSFFIIDPWFCTWADIGKARVRFLFESLVDLDRQLRELGSHLFLFERKCTQW
jgi:deoxyribodipyrimidine photo-lyase